jgi:hypothetical protein
MTFSSMNLHGVTNIIIGPPVKLDITGSWTRDIVVMLEGHRLTMNLFGDSESALGYQEKEPKAAEVAE